MRSRIKLKKDVKKKRSSKEGLAKTSYSEKKGGGSDEEYKSPRNRTDDREEDDEREDDIQWQTDTSLEAAHQRVHEQLNSVTAGMVMLSTDEKEKVSKATASSAVDESMVDDVESIHEKLVEEMKARLDKGISVKEFQSLLRSVLGSPLEVMIALYEALFAGIDKGFAKVVAKKKNYLAAAVAQSEGSQLLLLRAIEEFCQKPNPSAVKEEVALILKALYDADVLEEESIVQWYVEGAVGSNKDSPIRKNAKPFVDWLQSAESESYE